MDLLVIARARSVRSLLKRTVSRPAVGLNCLADFGSLSELVQDLQPPDFVLVDPEGFAIGELETCLQNWCSENIGVMMLEPERCHERASIPAEVLSYPKPEVTEEWERLYEELPAILVQLTAQRKPDFREALRIVGIGASAGGPAAIAEVLDALGDTIDELAVLVVQHIGPGFEEGLLSWISVRYPDLDADLAHDGEKMKAGALRLAPPGQHLLVEPTGCLRLDSDRDTVNGHRPSIDVLFRSLCTWPHPSSVAGVLLTGMGRDGASGLKELRTSGGLTLVQDAESSIVYGMPKAAMEAGAAEHALNPARIGNFLRRWVRCFG